VLDCSSEIDIIKSEIFFRALRALYQVAWVFFCFLSKISYA